MSAVLLLSTGVGERPGDLQVRVEDHRYLRVTVTWPLALKDATMLLNMWLEGDRVPKIEEYHPMVQGFCDYLEKFQEKMNEKLSLTLVLRFHLL